MVTEEMNKIPLNKEDVAFILGKCYRHFPAMIKGVYCNKCKSAHMTAFASYQIFLEETGDIVLDGFCDHCSDPLVRVIETSEKDEPKERALATWLVKRELIKALK